MDISVNFHRTKSIAPEFKTSGSTNWFSFVGDDGKHRYDITWFPAPEDVARFQAYVEAIQAVNRAFDSYEAAAEEKAA